MPSRLIVVNYRNSRINFCLWYASDAGNCVHHSFTLPFRDSPADGSGVGSFGSFHGGGVRLPEAFLPHPSPARCDATQLLAAHGSPTTYCPWAKYLQVSWFLCLHGEAARAATSSDTTSPRRCCCTPDTLTLETRKLTGRSISRYHVVDQSPHPSISVLRHGDRRIAHHFLHSPSRHRPPRALIS